MKDSRATSWLNMGASAARAGDRSDARFYLERALIADPDPDEAAQIWYWLSRITDDVAEKRRLLQDVVISQPGHAEARRDLAVLDGKLDPRDILDLREPAAPHQPAPVTSRRYVCPQCGGRLVYDAEAGALSCGYCGHRTSEFLFPNGDDQVDDQDFLVALPTARGQAWELPAGRRLSCQGCGAGLLLPPAQMTASCPFCGSPHVAEAAGGELVAPEAVVPFSVTAEAASALLRDRLGDQAEIAPPQPVYLPFWAFDLMGEITWRGVVEAPFERQPVTVSGSHPVLADNVLVAASHHLPAGALADLDNWDMAALRAYSPDLLADWPVEIYEIPLADASLVARQRVRADGMRAVRGETAGSRRVASLSFDSSGLVVHSFKQVLLPVWTAAYRLGGRPALAAVNGQTGAVYARPPRGGLRGLIAGMLGE